MLSKEEREKIRAAVRMVDPDTVAQKVGLIKTRIGWVCPECTNGSGSDKTGIVPKYLSQNGDHVEWHCHRCHCSWDNIAIAAKFKFNYRVDDKGRFNDANDFPKALEEVAKLLGVTIDENGKVHSPHAAKPEIFDDADDDIDESQLKDYSNFYSFAASGLKFFMAQYDNIYRGIPKSIYDYFWCGYVNEFGKAKTPAFIVPASKHSFLARFTGDEEKLSDEQKQNLRKKWHSPVPKPVFNFKRAVESDDPIIFVHEGEFDAISTFFGSVREEFIKANGIISLSKVPHVNAVALMGTAVTGKHKRRLRAEEIGQKFFVVVLDNDDAGIKETPNVVAVLKSLGHDAVGVRLSNKFNDANEFLQAEPENFAARIKEIFDDAKNGTLTDDEIFSTPANNEHTEISAQEPAGETEMTTHDIPIELQNKVTEWEKANGLINKDWLPQLFNEAKRIDTAELTPELLNDLRTQKSLGAFLYYSFLAETHARFFNRLRDEKDAAKLKIKAWAISQKDSTFFSKKIRGDKNPEMGTLGIPEPTDSEKFLANFNIPALERKVAVQLTAAKKVHKKYIEFARQQELAKQTEAEKRAYEDDTPTTKKFVADCPADLLLPQGVYFSDEGIQIIDFDKPAGKDGRIPVTACENPMIPTKILREPDKHVTQYEIAIKTGKYWRHAIFDGRTLQDGRSVSELGNFGAHISDARMTAKYFSKIIALNERNGKLTEIKSYTQPGWSDDTFQKFIWPTGGDDYVVTRKDFNYKKIFTPKGKADTLKKVFVEAMKRGGATARIYVGTALVAPLIRPFSLPNLQTQMHGLSGDGKTALEKLTAALFGAPDELISTFAGTNKNRLVVATAFNDLPTFIDELETTNGKKAEETLPQTIYNYSLSKGNQANKRDGTAREPFYFYGTRLYTGERPMLKDNGQRGLFKRLLQLECKSPFPDNFASRVHIVSENNYGHFGKQWIEFIIEHIDEIRKQYEEFAVLFTASLKFYEPTLVKGIVAASIAMQYFNVFLGEIAEFDDKAFGDDVNAIVNLLPTKTETNSGTRAKDDLRSFVDSHPKNFITEYYSKSDRTVGENCADGNETFGKIFRNGEVAIFPIVLRRILEKDLGFASAPEILAQWDSEGNCLYTTPTRKYQHKIKISGENKWTIHFKSGILAEPKDDEPTNNFDEEEDDYAYQSLA